MPALPAIAAGSLWLLPAAVLLAAVLRVLALRRQARHWKIAGWDAAGDALCSAALFALAAPPLELGIILLPELAATVWIQRDASALIALPVIPALAWVTGGLPALACGALIGVLKPWLPRWRGAVACTFLGALLGAWWFAAMGWSHDLRSLSAPALSGALGGGLLAAWHLRHNR